MKYFVLIKNRIPHKALEFSPFERLNGNNPTLKYVRVFGCAYFIIKHAPKSKLYYKAAAAILLNRNDHGLHTVECLTDGKIINSIHVVFDESVFLALDRAETSRSGECAGSNYLCDIEDSNSDLFEGESVTSHYDKQSTDELKGV